MEGNKDGALRMQGAPLRAKRPEPANICGLPAKGGLMRTPRQFFYDRIFDELPMRTFPSFGCIIK